MNPTRQDKLRGNSPMTNPTTPPTLKDDLKKVIRKIGIEHHIHLICDHKPNCREGSDGMVQVKYLDIVSMIREGFLLGQQSADDKWLKLIDDLDTTDFPYRSSSGLYFQGMEDMRKFILKSLSQNSPQDKTEHEKGLLNEVSPLSDKSVKPTDRMPEFSEGKKSSFPNSSSSGSPTQICTCGHDAKYHSPSGKCMVQIKLMRGKQMIRFPRIDEICSGKSFTPQPEKPEKERRGE